MWPFSTNDEPVDVKLAEPKRLSRKELEEQANLLNAQLDGAHEQVRQYDAARKETADENGRLKEKVAELNGKVSSLDHSCTDLHEKLQTNQAKLEGCEDTNQKLHLANASEAERNVELTDQLNELKNQFELKLRAVVDENSKLDANFHYQLGRVEFFEKECVPDLENKLKRFESLAERTEEVHKANKSLEEENKRIKLENERIESEMKALKQATEEKIADCESARLAQELAYQRLLARPKIVEKALFNAAKECVGILKKRKLGNTVGEQSFAGASLPIADVVPCTCDNGDRCVHYESVHQQPSSD
jgi:chromosome segregation ATPase